MAFSIIQTVYIAAFAYAIEKKGFSLRWYVPMAVLFMIAGLAASAGVSQDSQEAMLQGGQVLAVFLSLVFYPVQAFIAVRLLKFQKDAGRIEKLIVKCVIYIGSAMAASCIVMLFSFIGTAVYMAVCT